MNFYFIPPFITGIILGFIGFLVLLKNKRSSLNVIFSLFCFSMVWWLMGYTLMYASPEPVQALRWARVGFIGIVFVPILAYHFIVVLLRRLNMVLLVLLYLATIPALIFSNSSAIYNKVKVHFWGYYPEAGKFYFIFLSMFIILFGYGVLLLFKDLNSKKFSVLQRQQIQYVLLAFGIGSLGIVDYLIKYPILNIYPFGYICALLFIALIAYAIVKYGFLDIRVTIARGLILGLVCLPILAFPIVITIVKKDFLVSIFGEYFWLVPSILEMVVTLFGLFTYKKLQERAEKRLLQEEYQSAKAIEEISHELVRIREIKELAELVVSRCKNTVGAGYVGFYAKNKESLDYVLLSEINESDKISNVLLKEADPLLETLNLRRAIVVMEELDKKDDKTKEALRFLSGHLAIPCFYKDELLSVIILGYKTSSKTYSPIELIALRFLANQIAFALVHTEFVSEVRSMQEELDIMQRTKAEESLIKQQDEYQKKLVDASRRLLKMEKIEEVATHTVEMLSEHLDSLYVGIYVYNRDKGEYSLEAHIGESQERRDVPIEKEQYLVRYLYERKDPLRYSDLKRWSEESRSPYWQKIEEDARRIGADLIIPMVVDSLLGFVVLGKKRKEKEYTASDWNTLILVANNAAMAIRSIHMFEDSITDPLTLVYNRKRFYLTLSQTLAHAIRTKNPVSLLMLDIDKFKQYNDTYGHEEGDIILRAFGKYLRQICRGSDILCRWGGEEFTIIAADTSIDDAALLAERIREGMKKELILGAITVSIGVSCVLMDNVEERAVYDIKKTSDHLHKYADEELLRAKNDGRDRVYLAQTFRPSLDECQQRGRKPLKVLIVEDERIVSDNLSHYLRLKGFQVSSAGTCKESIEIFDQDNPDVVLLDLQLPDGDGTNVYRTITMKNPKVTIAVISGLGERKAELLKLGIKDFWLKPLDLSKIEEWLIRVAQQKL